MIHSTSGPQRLYLMWVQTITVGPNSIPVPCYLIQAGDGKNILIDTGYPRSEKAEDVLVDAKGRSLHVTYRKDVIEQLAMIGVQPADIDLLICTHYDWDHAGNHAAFLNARFVAQRRQHEVALTGHHRYAPTRSEWDQPLSRYQLLDGDTELLPGLELIETSGHVPGHQSVLVHLPKTGPVLLTIDAVALKDFFIPDPPVSPVEENGEEYIASTRKLLDLVEMEHVSLVIFGHDHSQWVTLKQLPEFLD